MSTAEPRPEPTFPLDSFKDAAVHMRRPFSARAIKFKVQATWPKAEPTGALLVAYIDARLAVERMNLLIPHLWHDEYEPLGTKHLICHLTVDGITRQDIGEGVGKGLYSDALKRAAVKFGVGVSLYAIPKMMLNKGAGVKESKNEKGEKSLALTSDGETKVRTMYADWLVATGVKAFGEPLDHGDVENSVGDADAEASKPISAPRATSPKTTPPATFDALRAAAKGLTGAKMKMAFASVGVTFPTDHGPFDRINSADAEKLIPALEQASR
jgi:hypothetical protein